MPARELKEVILSLKESLDLIGGHLDYRQLLEKSLNKCIHLLNLINVQNSSDAEIATLFETMIEGLVIQGEKGEIQKFNPSALRILGLTEGQLLGRTSFDPRWRATKEDGTIYPGDEHPAMVALKTNEPQKDKIMGLILPNGEQRWISINAIPFRGSSERKVLSIFHDVSELKETQRQNKEILKAVNEGAVFAKIDSEGFITEANSNFYRLWSGLETISNERLHLVSKKLFDKLTSVFKEVTEGKIWSGVLDGIDCRGRDFYLRTHISPSISSRRENCQEYVILGFDISDQKQIEKEFEEAQEIARIGSWTYDLRTGHQKWSSEHYRIFEIEEPQSQERLYQLYRERIHPEDRKELDEIINRAMAFGENFTFNHRVYLDNGSRIKHVRGQGKVTRDENGKPILVSGTCQDLTDLVALQEQNKFILESMGIGIWKFDPNSQNLIWDDSMYKLFDISKENFSGHYQAWESSLSPEAKQKAVHELELALSGQKPFDTTFEILTQNGLKKHIGGRGIVLRNDRGEPIMMYGINWDRTSEVQQEVELKSALDLNQAMLRSAKFAVITTDLEGLICEFNEESEKVLGFDHSEVIHLKSILEFYDTSDLEQIIEDSRVNFKFESSSPFECLTLKARKGLQDERLCRFKTKKDELIYVRINMTGLFDINKKLYGYMIIAKNVTKELELNNQLQIERAKSIQSAKLASLGEMSAGVAHEINNPLSIIVGSVALLPKYRDQDEKFTSKIDAIQKATARIEKIVKGLKKFSRSSEGSIHKPEDLNEILVEVINLTETKAKRFSTSVICNSSERLTIDCDSVEVEQVLVNLINNGIDAAKDSVDKWVRINAFELDDSVVLQIFDSGQGITKEVEGKLFQPFFTTKPVGEGTGLGLSIVKGILDQHRASIVLNRSYKNTCFEIRFPKHRGQP